MNPASRVLVIAVLCAALAGDRCRRSSKKPKPPDVAAKRPRRRRLCSAYIERVRAQQAAEVRTPGSIWSSEGRLVRLGTDAKAVRLHDVVSIVVTESLAGIDRRPGEELTGLERQFGADRAVREAEGRQRLQNLVGMTSSSGLTAQGQSTTNSSLATTFGAEVVDVLPNGMLVVQATRQLTFSQQTQLIRLRGLVRPEDVSAQNEVQSTAMTDLELEVTGKGIVNDSTYRPNPLVRLLERLLIF